MTSTQTHLPSSLIPHHAQGQRTRVQKRIIVCCDGTWEDGLTVQDRWMYTNILRLSRAINHEDIRFDPPMPQVVYYQAGIGSEHNLYAEYVQGATGASLAEKVQDAYAFIAHNYQPGDEIFIFGFSRGAYTARMIAMFIGAIGVLDRTEMDNFATIFVNLQKRGKSKDPNEIAELNVKLGPWTQHNSPGKARADSDADTYSVKCVGVFDTVGNLGLPDELKRKAHPDKLTTIFGFPNTELGEHIQYAFQALALEEDREDFNCTKWDQTPGGRAKGQVLKQCWFTGSHSDIGGGWHDHDLSDLTLTWMAANISDMISLDYSYLASLPDPVAPWGKQLPHDPRTGVFALSTKIQRAFPTAPNPVTNETIHPSVLEQPNILPPALAAAIRQYPQLVAPLMPLEQELKTNWPYVPGKNPYHDLKAEHLTVEMKKEHPGFFSESIIKRSFEAGRGLVERIAHVEEMRSEKGRPLYEKSRLSKLASETPFGKLISEVMPDRDPEPLGE